MQDAIKFEQYYEKLPKQVKAFISDELTNTLIGLEQKYHLHVDVSGDIADLVGDTIVGIVHPPEFIQKIQSISGLSKEISEKLIKDLETSVFEKVRAIALKPYLDEEKEEVGEMITRPLAAVEGFKNAPVDGNQSVVNPKIEPKASDQAQQKEPEVIQISLNKSPTNQADSAQVQQVPTTTATAVSVEQPKAPIVSIPDAPKKTDPYREPLD